MSVKTISTFSAVAAITGAALLTVPSPGGATPSVPLAPACTSWKLNSSTLTMNLSDGRTLEVPWSGSYASGAAAARLSGESDRGWAKGGADSGGRIDVTVVWEDDAYAYEEGDTNHVTGQIDPESGRPSGDFVSYETTHNWTSPGWFDCTAREPAIVTMQPPTQASLPAPAPASPQVPTVSVTSDVDVYDVPGGNGTVIGVLRNGRQVELVERKADNWCHVSGPDVPGGTGWVWGDFLSS